ncbi:MAG: hemerythrin domain-containing protein [Proteobacteria bacterium]|nr:hemerythrin domain-containing protein [Pseudomonadota bacterium]
MSLIQDYLTGDHRRCDELLSAAESAVDSGDWSDAEQKTQAFLTTTANHLRMEEEILFPAFEEATGMTQGPTAMMRQEHDQMRGLFAQIEDALQRQDEEDFLGNTETLLIMIQQHNMKEEGMLYPMADEHLVDQSEQLLDQMKKTSE